MEIIIDRIEKETAVVELPDGRTVEVPLLLFYDAAEGDVFLIKKDDARQNARRRHIQDKMNRLFDD